MDRRRFLRLSTTVSIAFVAGCNSTDEAPRDRNNTSTPGTKKGNTSTPSQDSDRRWPEHFENVIPPKETDDYRELSQDEWSQRRNGILRYGSTDNSGPTNGSPEYRWAFGHSADDKTFYSFEPIVAEGLVYIPGSVGFYGTYALDEKQGDLRWKKEAKGTKMTPIYKDGLLYITGDTYKEENLLLGVKPQTGTVVKKVPLADSFDYIPEIQFGTAIVDGSFYFVTAGRVYSVSMTDGRVEWEQTPILGDKPANRNAGISKNNRWITGIRFDSESNTLLCSDTTGFAYALDPETGEPRWARAVTQGDDIVGVSGTRVYKGKSFYKAPIPTVFNGKVIFDVGERRLEPGVNNKNSITYTDIGSGEFNLDKVTVGATNEVKTVEGRKIPQYFDNKLEYNPNYLTIDGDWLYFSQKRSIGAINIETGETWTAISEFSERGYIISPVVGDEAVYAIEYHDFDGGKRNVTTVFSMDKTTGEVLWSAQTSTEVRQLSIANGTLYACGKYLYAIQLRE